MQAKWAVGTIYPLANTALSMQVRGRGGGSVSQLTMGKRCGTAWAGCQGITGLMHRDKVPHTLTYTASHFLWVPLRAKTNQTPSVLKTLSLCIYITYYVHLLSLLDTNFNLPTIKHLNVIKKRLFDQYYSVSKTDGPHFLRCCVRELYSLSFRSWFQLSSQLWCNMMQSVLSCKREREELPVDLFSFSPVVKMASGFSPASQMHESSP